MVGFIGKFWSLNESGLILSFLFSGLADTFSYAFLGIVNKFIMSRDEDPKMFLWLFISLAGCSFLAVFVTSMVSTEKTEKIDEKPKEVQESNF